MRERKVLEKNPSTARSNRRSNSSTSPKQALQGLRPDTRAVYRRAIGPNPTGHPGTGAAPPSRYTGLRVLRPGRVPELADGQDSGSCARKRVGVQLPPRPLSPRRSTHTREARSGPTSTGLLPELRRQTSLGPEPRWKGERSPVPFEHDPERVARELAGKMAARARHLCMLLGAGACVSAGLPMVAELETIVTNSLPDPYKGLLSDLLVGRNLEQALSRIRRIRSLVEGSETISGMTADQAAELDERVCASVTEAVDATAPTSSRPSTTTRDSPRISRPAMAVTCTSRSAAPMARGRHFYPSKNDSRAAAALGRLWLRSSSSSSTVLGGFRNAADCCWMTAATRAGARLTTSSTN